MDLANLTKNDTIIAPATPSGMGAIAVLRISGPQSIEVVEDCFKGHQSNKKLINQPSHTCHYGKIMDNEKVIDEVLVTIFKGKKSYTGEETVEISCHGSTYITKRLLEFFIEKGIRLADAGEFTMRAYRNGRFDLAQAEAVADLIHSTNQTGAQIALNQMKGVFSSKIEELREQLINFASLMELELDFSEEDVEFADRAEFKKLIHTIQTLIEELIESFKWGNVIKNGIPVAIVGEPNVGKSTLLNTLLKDDRAIVSEIAGTTRDTIEDVIHIKGLDFRFIDTAGIRATTDFVEGEGIKKTFQKIKEANIVLHLLDVTRFKDEIAVHKAIQEIYTQYYTETKEKSIAFILNKTDAVGAEFWNENSSVASPNCYQNQTHGDIQEEYKNIPYQTIKLSAKEQIGIDQLIHKLTSYIDLGKVQSTDIIITNARHVAALTDTKESLSRVTEGIALAIPGDLLAIDIRAALHSLGTITGQITTDDLLGNIFSKFCIGK